MFVFYTAHRRRKIAKRVEAAGGWGKAKHDMHLTKQEVHDRKKAHKRGKRERRRRQRGFRSADSASTKSELDRLLAVRTSHSLSTLRDNLLSLADTAMRHPLIEAAKSLAQRCIDPKELLRPRAPEATRRECRYQDSGPLYAYPMLSLDFLVYASQRCAPIRERAFDLIAKLAREREWAEAPLAIGRCHGAEQGKNDEFSHKIGHRDAKRDGFEQNHVLFEGFKFVLCMEHGAHRYCKWFTKDTRERVMDISFDPPTETVIQ